MECIHCKGRCIKYGHQKSGKQRYKCKICYTYQQKEYIYQLYTSETKEVIIKCVKEGLGIRNTSRLLNISTTTIIDRIKQIASNIKKPIYNEWVQEYEVDEMWSFVKNKESELYITYAINRKTKAVIDFVIGKRTIENVRKVTDTLLLLTPKKIFTDRLNLYPGLIPLTIHESKRYRTNIIERNNLTIRTHLKRLSRKTICFSKSLIMLEACLKIYFWG